jgi:2,3-bisphosphoglycerate-dependent phosphoglycerate mutase
MTSSVPRWWCHHRRVLHHHYQSLRCTTTANHYYQKQQRTTNLKYYSALPSLQFDEEDHLDRISSSSSNDKYENSSSKIGRLILIRHGQSEWNVTDPTRNLTARFTGWADIGLTQQGKDQAKAAGRAIQLAVTKGILPSKDSTIIPAIDVVFCSLLKRANDTMNIILEEIQLAEKIVVTKATPTRGTITSFSSSTLSQTRTTTATIKERPKLYQYPIPIIQSWRLNERHYGALVGLSKQGAERLYGKVRLTRWRDSWDVAPPPMPIEMVKKWGKEDHCKPVTIVRVGDGGRTCIFDPAALGMQTSIIQEHGGKRKKIADIEEEAPGRELSFMPPSESLRDVYERFLPLWTQGIAKHIRAGRTVLVVAHANTIRSILVAIDGEVATKDNAKKVKIPSALPLVYEFVDGDDAFIRSAVEDDSEEDNISVVPSAKPSYTFNGVECSGIIPGNLRVLKPHANNSVTKMTNTDFRYQLNGTWVETDETKSVSFCTDLGKQMGEQDIA